MSVVITGLASNRRHGRFAELCGFDVACNVIEREEILGKVIQTQCNPIIKVVVVLVVVGVCLLGEGKPAIFHLSYFLFRFLRANTNERADWLRRTFEPITSQLFSACFRDKELP